jgi:hypothetical protein
MLSWNPRVKLLSKSLALRLKIIPNGLRLNNAGNGLEGSAQTKTPK